MVSATWRKRISAFLLAGTLVSCRTAKEPEAIPQAASASPSSLETKIQLESFSKFNPPKAERFISLSNPMMPYVLGGLDGSQREAEKSIQIKYYFAFEAGVYAVAQKLGYALEEVTMMGPKEALSLTGEIVAHQMNYFATNEDHHDSEERKKRSEKVRNMLNQIQIHPDVKEEEQKQVIEGIRLLQEVVKKQSEIRELEIKISGLGSLSTYRAGFDNTLSPSELFLQQQPIVCRQYAAIARDVFFILKQRNPRLQNTYVAVYTHKNHAWNQAATIYQDQSNLHIDITFFDST